MRENKLFARFAQKFARNAHGRKEQRENVVEGRKVSQQLCCTRVILNINVAVQEPEKGQNDLGQND